jgi:hypothetical protein
MSSTALHGVTRRKQKGGLTMSWDRRINPGINPNAGKPYRFQRQKGGQSQGQIGDILQRAVTSAVVNSTKYVNRRIKK